MWLTFGLNQFLSFCANVLTDETLLQVSTWLSWCLVGGVSSRASRGRTACQHWLADTSRAQMKVPDSSAGVSCVTPTCQASWSTAPSAPLSTRGSRPWATWFKQVSCTRSRNTGNDLAKVMWPRTAIKAMFCAGTLRCLGFNLKEETGRNYGQIPKSFSKSFRNSSFKHENPVIIYLTSFPNAGQNMQWKQLLQTNCKWFHDCRIYYMWSANN